MTMLQIIDLRDVLRGAQRKVAGIFAGYEVSPPGATVKILRSPRDKDPITITGTAFQTVIAISGPQLYIDAAPGVTVSLRIQGYLLRRNTGPFEIGLPKELSSAIGELVAQWAFLESQIDESIQKLCNHLGEPDAKEIMRLSFKDRRRHWVDLIKQMPDDPILTSRLLDTAKRIGEIERERHKLAHARWEPHDTVAGTMIAFSENPTSAFTWKVNAKRVTATAEKIAKINRHLILMLRDYGSAIPASPGLFEILETLDLSVSAPRRSGNRAAQTSR